MTRTINTGRRGYVSAGETLKYTIEFENEGQGKAFGVYITDVLDEDLDDSSLSVGNFRRVDYNTSAETPAVFSAVYNPPTRTLTVFIDNGGEVGSKQGGKFDLTASVRNNALPGTSIVNYATVYFPSVPEETRTNAVVSVVPHFTQLTYGGDTSAVAGRDVKLEATLKTASGGAIPNQKVRFSVGADSYGAVTDEYGVATYYVNPPAGRGRLAISADYAGDGFYYLPSLGAGELEKPASKTLDGVYAFPNPFKLTDGLAETGSYETGITFARLTETAVKKYII